jgi:hypothetical protein
MLNINLLSVFVASGRDLSYLRGLNFEFAKNRDRWNCLLFHAANFRRRRDAPSRPGPTGFSGKSPPPVLLSGGRISPKSLAYPALWRMGSA